MGCQLSIMTGSNIVLQLTVLISNFYNCVCVTKLQRRTENCRGLVRGLGQVTHGGGGDAGDGYSPVLGQVATVVPGAGRHMLGHHPSAGEHSYLVSDVLPVSRGLNLKTNIFLHIFMYRLCKFTEYVLLH